MERSDKSPTTIPIPKIFKSDLTGAYLNKCIQCECDLLVEGKNYLIEKAIKPYGSLKSYSTIFEYAMCMDCAEKMRMKISSHSMKTMSDYFSENMNPAKRFHLDPKQAKVSIDPWLSRCAIKQSAIDDMPECQIYAHCVGDQLIVEDFPQMISGEVLDEMMSILSVETKDEFDRMKDELVGGPSEFHDLLQGGPRVFI